MSIEQSLKEGLPFRVLVDFVENQDGWPGRQGRKAGLLGHGIGAPCDEQAILLTIPIQIMPLFACAHAGGGRFAHLPRPCQEHHLAFRP